MKRLLPLAVALAVALAGCGGDEPKPAAETAAPAADAPADALSPATDAKFADIAKRWLDGAMRLSPVSATSIGDHRFDAEIDDLSAEARAKGVEFSRQLLGELDTIVPAKLTRENQVDMALLRNQLRYDIWSAEKLQGYAWDPMVYSQLAGGALYSLMAREFAPLPDRLRAATARMEKLPMLLEQMRGNLDFARVPKIHAETAAKQNNGVLSIVDGLIMPHAGELPEAERKRLEAAAEGLKKAVAEHQKWLDSDLVPNAKGDFRIGKELYDAKLAFALNSPLSREEIKRRAEGELARVRAEMYDIARQVFKDKPGAPAMPDSPTPEQQQAAIAAALDIAAKEHPPRDQVVESAKAALEKTTAFVREKNLIGMPDSPVEIILMPEFQRGVAIAYCDSPGPLDKGQKTFYAVSPIPDDWDTKQVESFLREYNTRSINELTVHEAMPGHYLQLWHSNKYPSTLRAVLSSGPFVEGWAVYAERLMAEAGYYDNDPLYRLVQRKWYLRAVANAILDQAIHVDGMTREQAMELMTKQTFQEEREAALKWVRAQLTSAQLPTYFVGYQEHADLRKLVEDQKRGTFDVRRFHDELLSHGSPPVRYARALMLNEEIQ
ncbi:MAG TPA: DUF885 domain-containing protein [Xanthomonadales bacterium]|nr:DUF885 domain-containing protein [Xanthomonadales bacterium]